MKQIKKMMVQAFNANREMKLSNTSVSLLFSRYLYVYLHGNAIACKDIQTGETSFSCAGWHTTTTASRLRALGADAAIRHGRMVHAATGEPFPCRLS